MTSATPELITKKNIKELLSEKETFMFDCDGVLWRDGKAFPGVAKLIEHLRNVGKKIFFISNNNTKSRRQYVEKFDRLGIDTKEEEIYSSGYAAVYYIKHIAKIDGKVYVIGTSGLVEELDKESIPHIGFGPDNWSTDGWSSNEDLSLDPEVTCVLHGFDGFYGYRKMKIAANYLANESVLFVATNKDFKIPTGDGIVVPGTGCMVVATEAAASRKAIICGKPESLIMDCILKKRYNINPEKACMIGDNIHTDVEFGNKCRASTILVLSGVCSLADVEKEKKQADERNLKIPDYYINSLTEFYELIINE